MGRYLGSKHRMCRRVGEKLCDQDRCPVTRRAYPAGVHGPKGKKQKMTEYGAQLLEKQKARNIYGLLERQFRNYVERARRMTGDTGIVLGQLLERRLDNTVFRMGIAKTRAAARQAVSHGHITVNGKRVTIPSYLVTRDAVIAVHPALRTSPLYADFARTVAPRTIPAWLAVDGATFSGRIVRLPEPDDTPQPYRMRAIVEFYSR